LISVCTVSTPSYVPTEVVFGGGVIDRLPELARNAIARHGATRATVISGTPTATRPWLTGLLGAVTERTGASWRAGPSGPADLRRVSRIVDEARRQGVDFVIAIGGGSVIDTAKTVALLARSPVDLHTAVRRLPDGLDPLPLVVAPTTAGSGSEVTRTATLWGDSPPAKYSLDHPALFPELAVVDPLVAATAPADVFASAALDALAQGVESLWAIGSDAESRDLAGSAIDYVFSGLSRLNGHPADPETLHDLSLGSVHAGLAIARSRTTLAHAISYPLTARYGIRHGHACALSLARVLSFNAGVTAADCLDQRGPEHVRDMVAEICARIGLADAEAAGPLLESLLRRLGLGGLDAFPQVDPGHVARVVAASERASNNPRRAGVDSVRRILTLMAAPLPVERY
jgi:alcohol dehydrogenase class IV